MDDSPDGRVKNEVQVAKFFGKYRVSCSAKAQGTYCTELFIRKHFKFNSAVKFAAFILVIVAG
jgi:hypothetical protein